MSKGGDASLETLSDHGILALQGPKAASVLQPLASTDLSQLSFMQAATVVIAGVPCFVARSGYTGEDGFELSVPAGDGELPSKVR